MVTGKRAHNREKRNKRKRGLLVLSRYKKISYRGIWARMSKGLCLAPSLSLPLHNCGGRVLLSKESKPRLARSGVPKIVDKVVSYPRKWSWKERNP